MRFILSNLCRVAVAVVSTVVIAVGCASSALKPSNPLIVVADPIVAAWGITTPSLVENATRTGINAAILYGPPPILTSQLGRTLNAHHIPVISAEISQFVSNYECARTHSL